VSHSSVGSPRRLSRTRGRPSWQLAAHVASFALAIYAFSRIFAGGHVENYLAWFVGAALLHDLVLLPVYSALDRAFGSSLARAGSRQRFVNHVRVPALISGLLMLVYFPLILGLSSRTYTNATGHHPSDYLRNWLLITAAVFMLSGGIWVLRRIRGR